MIKVIGLEKNIRRQDFLEFIDEVSTAESVKELVGTCERFTTYKSVMYHHITSVGAHDHNKLNRFWASGFTDEVLAYLEAKSRTSEPAMQYVLNKARPYWLSDLLEEDEFSEGRNKWRVDLAITNIGDTLLLPLFGPFDRRGYIAISFEKPREFYDPIFTWQVQGIFQAVHIRYCMLVEALKASVKLTKREGEVLELITFGKTNPEIGIVLGISANTVSGHLKRIFLKFDASDRVTVALRARRFNF